MRCDYPMSCDGDFLEPISEEFELIQFVDLIAVNALGNEDAEFDIDYYSEDNFSLHTISDGSLCNEELSNDEEDSIIHGTISEISINPENTQNETSTIGMPLEESHSPENGSAEGYQIVAESTDAPSKNNQCSKSSLTVNNQNSGIVDAVFQETNDCTAICASNFSPSTSPKDNITSISNNFVSLCVGPPKSFSRESDILFELDYDNNFSLHSISDASLCTEELSGDEGECIIHSTISETSINPENTQNENSTIGLPLEESHSTENERYQVVAESTDAPSENNQYSQPSLTVNNQNSGTINAVFQETDDCTDICASNFSPSNEVSFSGESMVQINASPSDNITSISNTVVSLYVGPSKSFSCESDILLSDVSSNRLLSDAVPVSSQSELLVVSDNGNIASEDESFHTFNKTCDNLKESIHYRPAICGSFSVSEDKHMSDSVSALDNENSIFPENSICFDENSHSEFIDLNSAHLSEKANLHKDEKTNCCVTSDKSVPNLKRKVACSVDCDIMTKVPKYSLSNESLNEVSLDNYNEKLENDSVIPLLCDEGEADIVPSTVSVESVILSLEKSVSENSVTEQRQIDL